MNEDTVSTTALTFRENHSLIGRVEKANGVWNFVGDAEQAVAILLSTTVSKDIKDISLDDDCTLDLSTETLSSKSPITATLMQFALELFKQNKLTKGNEHGHLEN